MKRDDPTLPGAGQGAGEKATAQAAANGPLWPATHLTTLDSGLRVVTASLPQLRAAAAMLNVRVGSRYETPAESGISHLLEHLLFRGCARWPGVYEFNAAVERVALGLNAATSRELTVFDVLAPGDTLPEALELLGGMVSAPLLADFELERAVVIEEIQDELDEQGRDVDVDNVAKQRLFAGGGLALKVGGRRESLMKLDEGACRRWYERYYGARNMVLGVAGPVEHEAVVEAARRAFADLPAGELRAPEPARWRKDLPAFEYVADRGSQTTLQMGWMLPAEEDPRWPAFAMLQRLLDDGTSARLRRRIVDELGLAYHIGCELEVYEGLSLMTMESSVVHESAVRLIDSLLAVVAELASEPVPDEEWERLQRRLRFDWEVGLDSAASVAGWIGHRELLGLEDRYSRLAAVDRRQLREAASTLGPDALQLVAVGDLAPTARANLRRRVHKAARARAVEAESVARRTKAASRTS